MSRTVNGFFMGACILAQAVVGHAQTFESAPLARELAQRLQNASMDTFAAPDPREPGRFVAALFIPRGQLLVVSAMQPSIEAVARRVRAGEYHDVYLDLQATPTPMGKFFVQDAGADGLLHAAPGSHAVDVVYEDGVRSIRFDGDPAGQHLDSREYDARFRMADHRYADALQVLNDAFAQHR